MTESPILAGVTVIIAAAGRGMRFGGDVAKQYLEIDGKPVIAHAIERLEALGPREILLVVAADDERHQKLDVTARCRVVIGGETRADSVRNALAAIDVAPNDWIMVHDAARPCFRIDDVRRLVERVQHHEAGGLLASRVVETVKLADEYGQSVSTENRDALWLAQTPQMFRFELLKNAMADAMATGVNVTDEASALEYSGYRPALVEGDRSNIKITLPRDLELAAWLLSRDVA